MILSPFQMTWKWKAQSYISTTEMSLTIWSFVSQSGKVRGNIRDTGRSGCCNYATSLWKLAGMLGCYRRCVRSCVVCMALKWIWFIWLPAFLRTPMLELFNAMESLRFRQRKMKLLSVLYAIYLPYEPDWWVLTVKSALNHFQLKWLNG